MTTTIKLIGTANPMLKDFKKLSKKDVPRATRNALTNMGRAIFNDSTRSAAAKLGVPARIVRGGVRAKLTGIRTRARAIYFRPSRSRPVARIRVYHRPIGYSELGAVRGLGEKGTTPGRQRQSRPFIAKMPSGRVGLFARVAPKRTRTPRQRKRNLPIAEIMISVDPTLPAEVERRIARADSSEWGRFFEQQYQRIVGR